jgi:hypothetical protein
VAVTIDGTVHQVTAEHAGEFFTTEVAPKT